jgi:hypothetical protein
MRRLKNALCAMLLCALSGCIHTPPIADFSAAVVPSGPSSATLPFMLDDNRIFVEVAFVRPDGSERKALAFVNMGAGALALSNALFRELAPTPGTPLHMKFGAMDIAVDGDTVQPERMANSITISFHSRDPSAASMARGPGGLMAAMADPLPVEAMIPPGMLQHFQVVYDYAARTMTLAAPGTLKPEGMIMPVRLNPKTGFIMADVATDGVEHPFVIDNGGSFGLIRDASIWTEAHPDWLRAQGGVGEANYLMNGADVGDGVAVVKLRDVTVGPLHLDELGVVQTYAGGMLGGLVTGLFWNRIYDPKAGEEVVGAIGGNTLRNFRFTVDYPNRTTWWLQQGPFDTHDLDQVGITLVHEKGVSSVGGLVLKGGKPTVDGVQPGDKIVKIDNAPTAPMTRGQLLSALHGTPGETKHLTIERAGALSVVDVPVTGF